VACHLNTLASPWVRFGEMAAKFLRTKDDPDELKNFVNSWLGEPWETATAKVDADVVLERQTETPTGVVPEGAVLLTGGVDVQEDRFYWTVRAWGTRLTSWNVAHGEALDWGQIEQIMNR
jgi:phage terminase large subunit GpA-like protein